MTTKASRVELPFGISRVIGQTLVEQVADGIRQAIRSGRYKPGEILPTRRELAKALDVSERVPREAVALLAKEGIVYTRRCLGCVVAEKGERQWLGRVLFVESDDYSSFYYSALSASFQRRMSVSGYLVLNVTCPVNRNGTVDVAPLEEALRQTVDFVVLPFADAAIARTVENAGIPFLVASRTGSDFPHCVERFEVGSEDALRGFVEHCEHAGIKSIVQVGVKGGNGFLDLRPYFRYNGIKLTTWEIPRFRGRIGIENETYGVMNAFSARLKDGWDWLPDVLFFRDDFAAMGALTALLDAQVKIPEDVKVVTLSNRGNCPVFPSSLARLELDPIRNGEVLVDHVLQHLAPARRTKVGEVGYRYIRGKTFP